MLWSALGAHPARLEESKKLPCPGSRLMPRGFGTERKHGEASTQAQRSARSLDDGLSWSTLKQQHRLMYDLVLQI